MKRTARATVSLAASASRAIPLAILAPTARTLASIANWVRGIGGGATSFDEEVAAAVRFLPARDAIICDVGANKGDWTRSMLRRAGERVGRVFVFEPSEAHRDSLSSLDAARCTI